MNTLLGLLFLLALFGLLALFAVPLMVATIVMALALFYNPFDFPLLIDLLLWGFFLGVGVVINVPDMRRRFISDPVLRFFRRVTPEMSATEREALEAGSVWFDGDLFSGDPDWEKILRAPAPKLTDEEQTFLDTEVEELCRLLDDWDITEHRHDLPPEVWEFLKKKKFFGMIIPKKYGGLEFSALAHSAVVMKVASRSITAAVTVMVPNSLGPAELILDYGTDEQKNEYLPKLADGTEVPCFALTGPEAGSDAGSLPDNGVVCRGMFNDEEVVGIRLNFDKRYITLSSVATVAGLAFRLYDPEHLLGEEEDRGITVALLRMDTPGVDNSNRHAPLSQAFMNGPLFGANVFIPVSWIIGGPERVGQGWRMLMENLAVGRSISLPALSVAGAKLSARSVGAYAAVRRQFRTPIGKFEGVEEPLAAIGSNAYLMEATRTLTLSAIDRGEKPSVISAIVKYHLTERLRSTINHAMDIQGGGAISMGPRNFLGRTYQSIPVAITVEGANILTRSLIIFGQGALRCHPWVLKEMAAAKESDPARASHLFDEAFFGHVGFTLRNAARSFFRGLTRSTLAPAPRSGPTKIYFQELTRLSAAFALLSDACMLVLGGDLKRKEKISARLGDVLSNLYMASATLKRFEDSGRAAEEKPLMRHGVEEALATIEIRIDEVLRNFPVQPVAWALRLLIFPVGRWWKGGPSDQLGHKVARLLLRPSATRDALTEGVYAPDDINDPVGRLEDALRKSVEAEEPEKKLKQAQRDKRITAKKRADTLRQAVEMAVLSDAEKQLIEASDAARHEVITVDHFPLDYWDTK